MEAVVTSIQGLSGSPGDLQSLQTSLKNQASVLVANVGSIPAALQSLNPELHSLGYLWLL